MRLLLLPFILVLVACGPSKKGTGDEVKVNLGTLQHVTGMERCKPELALRDCVDLSPPQRISGVWKPGFESSEFIPAGSEASQVDIWLEPDEATEKRYWHAPLSNRYAVEFMGRRSRYEGKYGHMGLSKELVVMDKLISIRELPKD